MEGLAPALKCLIEIQSGMKNGETIRGGLMRFLQLSPSSDEFTVGLRRFLFAWDQGQDWQEQIRRLSSPQRRALAELITVGLSGQPILPHLEELRIEMISACEIEVKRHLELLPLKMLAPLLLLQFPAFLTLLFGPLLNRFLMELSR